MFDLQDTIRLVTGMIQSPKPTGQAYRETDPPWMQTFMRLPLPVTIAGAIAAAIVAWITGGSMGGGAVGLATFVFMVVSTLVWSFVFAFIIDFLAGIFDGEKNFDRAYALVGLVLVISIAGNVLGVIPWIGWIANLALLFYGLYLVYELVPVFLAVPEGSRVKHLVATVVAAFVASMVVFGVLGALLSTTGAGVAATSAIMQSDDEDEAAEEVYEPAESTGGLFGGFERQVDLAEQAAADTYTPPANGKLTDDQVETFVDVLKKTQALRERLGKKLENMDEKEPSLGDIFSGVGGAMRAGTAEMEVVKTRGGNWAEHQWVRNQLETARIQQDINDTVAHNYALFLEYQEDIEANE